MHNFPFLTMSFENGAVRFRWRDYAQGNKQHGQGKGSGETKSELPPPVWEAIRDYLDLLARHPTGQRPALVGNNSLGLISRRSRKAADTTASSSSMRNGLAR